MLERLLRYSENVLVDEPLFRHSTFKIGGLCDFLVLPSSLDELVGTLKFLRENDVNYRVIGNGSNILFSDNGFRGVIVKTAKLNNIELRGNTIIADSGASLMKMCDFALKNSLDGISKLCGIPGSVGGAVYMNAGAYGGEIRDALINSCYLDTEDFEVKRLEKNEHQFGYRKSFFTSKNHIILKSEFLLTQGDYENIKSETAELLKKRSQKQPLNYPSAGSTFKRPPDDFAGRLIEEAGLKGYFIGGAAVSEKHSGFVINKGGATSDDVLRLIEHIKNEVQKKFDVILEAEVIYIE